MAFYFIKQMINTQVLLKGVDIGCPGVGVAVVRACSGIIVWNCSLAAVLSVCPHCQGVTPQCDAVAEPIVFVIVVWLLSSP